jgi:enoyl-CoA hydratase/carnithine racemase
MTSQLIGEHVLMSADGGVGRIVLNRPDKRNALTHTMMASMLSALDRFSGDDGIRVVMLSANGQAFCSGVDLADMQAVREQRGSFDYELLPEVFTRLASHRNPTVAMVHGAAVAGGCELALHCDIRIGSPATTSSMPLAKLGLVLPCAPAERLVAVAGKTLAADMLLTGSPIEGVRAERVNLLTRLVDHGRLESETEALVQQIANNAPLSLRAMKAMLQALSSTFHPADSERFEADRVAISRSHDMREGLEAFFQRRPPEFTGN